MFTALALIALPSALGLHLLPDRTLIIVAWISQTFIQLVALSLLQISQNAQGSAADKRAELTYKDVEAILHEIGELHRHLDESAAGDTKRPRRSRGTPLG